MRQFIELVDGRRVPLALLPSLVPHACLTSAVHIEVCGRLARRGPVPDESRDVYVNMLFKRSDFAKQITALEALIRTGAFDVRRVTSTFIDDDFSDLLGEIEQVILPGTPRNYLSRHHVGRFVLKACAHRLFRLFRRRRFRADQVIRTWADISERVFGDLVETTSLLVYPFSGNRMRQLRYLWRSRQLGRNYSLMGLPYRMSHVIRLLLSGNGRDRLLVESEIDGYRRHADELLACGIKKLYTTDESEAASGRLHGALIDDGVHCVNRGHGVAVYGPFVRYSHFSFYDRLQHLRYAQLGKFDTFDTKAGANNRNTPPSRPGENYSPAVIAIQGNWHQAEKHYEEQFEEQAYRSAGSVCRELNLPMFLKLHPDTNGRTRRRLVSKLEIPHIDHLDELKGRQPIFLNTAVNAV